MHSYRSAFVVAIIGLALGFTIGGFLPACGATASTPVTAKNPPVLANCGHCGVGSCDGHNPPTPNCCQDACGFHCANLENDVNNCGSCNHKCASSGTSACVNGQCGFVCHDGSFSTTSCGDCNGGCTAGTTCCNYRPVDLSKSDLCVRDGTSLANYCGGCAGPDCTLEKDAQHPNGRFCGDPGTFTCQN